MISNVNRIGRFTSSKAYLLAASGTGKYGFSAGALTYINQRRAERALGRSVDTGRYAQAMAWGKLMEHFAERELGFDYEKISLDTKIHPKYNFWSGSPDLIVPKKKISEVKCYYPENYFNYASALLLEDVAYLRKNFPAEYWQIVSNAIIFGLKYGEGVAFMPRKSKLIEIAHLIENTDFIRDEMGGDGEKWKYRFIPDKVEENIEELPFLPDDVPFPHLAKFEFKIPTDDIIFLTRRFIDAEKLLNESPTKFAA